MNKIKQVTQILEEEDYLVFTWGLKQLKFKSSYIGPGHNFLASLELEMGVDLNVAQLIQGNIR